MYTNKKKMK